MQTTSTSSKKICWSSAALALLLGAALTAPAARSPRDTVTAMADEVITVLKDDGLASAAKRRRIEAIVYAAVEFDILSRLVMARNWARLDAQQQDEFLREFRRHLSATYGKRIDSYSNETVEVTGEREEARGDRTVRTAIRRGGGNADILVDYRLRQREGEWKIIDFVIEGVSLVANFRSQFQELMTSGGPDHLLQALRRKTAEEEAG